MVKVIGNHKNPNSYERWQYMDAPMCSQEWLSIKEWMPYPYDLVDVCTSQKEIKKAWHTGYEWFGYKLTEKDEVCFWRRKERISINE